MSTPMLEMRNVETFYGPIMAIRGVSLEVNEGEIVAVLGANGAGKTTLLKTATGALDSRKGRVLFEGKEIQNRDPDWVARRGIAHVPEGREVFPFLTVTENLAMGAYTRSDRDGIAADLETVYGYFPVLRELGGKISTFDYRGLAPAFAGTTLHVCGEPTEEGVSVWTEQVGTKNMSATATA